MATHNKPIAYMAADVITQAYVLRKSISDYPQCNLHETATNAIAKTLPAIAALWRVTGARFHRGLVLTLRDSA